MFSDFLNTPLGDYSPSPRTAYSASSAIAPSPRSRKPAFYRGTPPTFTSSLKCVQSGAMNELPENSWEITISIDGNVTKEGKVQNEQFLQTLPRFPISISQTQGKRNYMEDFICSYQIDKEKEIVAIIDGHHGDLAGKICCEYLKEKAHEYINFLDEMNFHDLFKDLHEKIIKETESGCTISVIYFGIETIQLGYVGDCSVYLCSNFGLKKVTKNHHLDDISEEKRIIEEGGVVEIVNGIKRVNGKINITRSLGDKELHPPLTYEPEVMNIQIEKGLTHILLTTDGMDSIDIKEMEKLIKRSPNISMTTTALRNEAFKMQSQDNISVLLVDLKYSNYERKIHSPLADDLCIAGGDEENPFDE